jgi:hypothetical protein
MQSDHPEKGDPREIVPLAGLWRARDTAADMLAKLCGITKNKNRIRENA